MREVIAVAGGTGILGSKIVNALIEKGVEVRVIARLETDARKIKALEKSGAKVFVTDYADSKQLVNVLTGATCVVSALSGLREVIIDAQKHLLDAAVSAKVPRFIPSDFSIDFTKLKNGENRNLDLRREFHLYLDKAEIKATTIFNGAFTELLTGDMPMILFKQKRIMYYGNADQRMDFVSIVTPNFAHFEPAMLALENGFHVLIDKPVTLDLKEAKLLQQKVNETGLLLCLTHTYAAYPMVKQARQMVKENKFGQIRKICVEYPQGWLSAPADSKQAAWRTDPEKSGISGCMADIGTHAAHLSEYISGLKITKICADLNIVVNGRALDDDGNVLLKFNNGANGVLIASQIATGEENALKIKLYGEKGGLEWHQMEPNTLIVKWPDAPEQHFRTGNAYISTVAKFNTRTPAGHPEGYLEAFANIYRNFAYSLSAKINNEEIDKDMIDFPGIE
ncbi:MAG: NAD-dependent epimerase/dehydratase family protein, partial [Sphingobacteriales bacterium]